MLSASICMSGQAQITTKKEKLSDFTLKTMKVVLSGNDFIDPALKQAIKNTWTLSPYEFCTFEEFDNLKQNESFYFLIPVKAQFRKESAPGTMLLVLAKGKAGAKGPDDMLEVVSIPLCAADFPSGREAAILPGLTDIIQSYVSKSLSGGFSGLGSITKRISSDSKIYIAESEVSEGESLESLKKYEKRGVYIVPDETADEIFTEGEGDALISYLVAPFEPEKGSVYWTMLIGARTHELHHLQRHIVGDDGYVGFKKRDFSSFSR